MDANDRRVTGFAMLGHAMFHTFEFAIPLFVVLWLDAFSTTTATLGLVVGAGFALTGVGAFPAGVLADIYPSKSLVVACMLGMSGGFLLVALAPSIHVLALGLVLWGAAASLYHPAGLALLSRAAKARGTALAYHGAAGNVGVATGPLLGAVLLAFFHWRVVAVLLVVPVLAGALLAARLEFDETAAVDAEAAADGGRDDDADVGSSGSTDVRQLWASTRALVFGGFLPVFLVMVLYGLYYRGSMTFLVEILSGLAMFDPVDVFGRSLAPSQYVYSGILLLGGLGQYTGGKLVDRIRVESALLLTFGALVAVALAFVPATEAGVLATLVVAGLLGFFVFMEAPINQALIAKHAPPAVTGLSFGYTYLATFGVGALGASIAGVVLTRSGPGLLFAVVAAFGVGAIALGGYLLVRS
ncbi:MAG: MFS transporter [Haloarculaceae archaeon]